MAQDGFKLSKGGSSNVTTGAFFAARDEYRKHPILNNHMKRSMPGFGIALAAFGVYLFVDGMSSRMSSTKKESHWGEHNLLPNHMWTDDGSDADNHLVRRPVV